MATTPTERRTEPLTIHVRPAEAAAIRSLAAQHDRSVSSELAQAVRAHLEAESRSSKRGSRRAGTRTRP